MDLQNILEHKRNTKVFVNGRLYQIDGMGIVRDVRPEDSKKLLLNRNVWRLWDAPPAKPAPIMPAPKAEVPKPSITPILATSMAPIEQGPVEEDGEEEDWPDPDMSMSKGKLREIADAYEIPYEPRTKKVELVKLIEKAMYPDGK